eukprot:TRINITY_DN3502_c0_g1_i1.p2 TRINITY_DN3502_c0_g1~~TRINITY_DN3502_c0_g1_i1.p2  ORF type:complete len:584 (+),score=120.96 TRINITY_DN3502_c0_g1_i1:4852-6603(+)
MHTEFKTHFNKLKKEHSTLGQQYGNSLADKRHLEAELESQRKHFTGLLEQRQKTVDEFSTRSATTTDPEILKARIAKTVEAPYKQKLDNLNEEIEQKDFTISELTRENKLLKTDLEATRNDYERQLKNVKQKYLSQIDDLNIEIQELQGKLDDTRDKELVRIIKREKEEYKKKLVETQRDLLEAKSTITVLKNEVESLERDKQRFCEQVRMESEEAEKEINRITEKFKQSEEDHVAELQELHVKNKQLQQLLIENEALKGQVQELEIELGGYKKQIQEVGGTLKERELEIEACILQIQEENKENSVRVKEEKQILQNEIERLETTIKEMEESHKDELETITEKLEATEKQGKAMYEDQQQLRTKLEELQASYESIKTNYEKIVRQSNKQEDEIFALQARYRNSLTKEQELVTAKDHLEVSLQLMKEEHEKYLNEKAEWNAERTKLQSQIVALTRKIETITKEAAENVKRHVNKAAEYKSKVRRANLKLQQMTTKLAQYQAEIYQNFTPGKIEASNISNAWIQREVMSATPDPDKLEADIELTLERNKEQAQKRYIFAYQLCSLRYTGQICICGSIHLSIIIYF